jgi:hypothetical protein
LGFAGAKFPRLELEKPRIELTAFSLRLDAAGFGKPFVLSVHLWRKSVHHA